MLVHFRILDFVVDVVSSNVSVVSSPSYIKKMHSSIL